MTSQADNKLQTLEDGATGPQYRDIALERGVTAQRPYVGDGVLPSTAWHPEFDDVNNDGLIDLFVAKGNVDAQVDYASFDPNNLLLGQKNGTFVERGEQSRSLAIAPDGQSFVLGAEWSLSRFDAAGQRLWRNSVFGIAWGVNLSSDGSLVIVAHGDGTLRWYRASDGAELLAFFVHAPDKKWVAWTPSGYYAASPGGEDLIGWHVNGPDWGDSVGFFPASRFREKFYRPDIVKLVLKTMDEGAAVTEANSAAKRSTIGLGVCKYSLIMLCTLSPGTGITSRRERSASARNSRSINVSQRAARRVSTMFGAMPGGAKNGRGAQLSPSGPGAETMPSI